MYMKLTEAHVQVIEEFIRARYWFEVPHFTTPEQQRAFDDMRAIVDEYRYEEGIA